MKNSQNGRSMIEMLGVLAIIGVLSIGGLAGYTMAMNRHRANQILDYVSRCAVAAQTFGDGYYIGHVTKSFNDQGVATYTVTDGNCGEFLPLEDGPNGLAKGSFVVASVGPDKMKFTVVTPSIASDDIRTALVNRDNTNVGIVSNGSKQVVFTFKK